MIQNLLQICTGEGVAGKDHFVSVVGIQTLDHFNGSSGAEVGTADTADNDHFCLILQFLTQSNDPLELLFIVIYRPVLPAKIIISGTCLVYDLFMDPVYRFLITLDTLLKMSVCLIKLNHFSSPLPL